MLDTLGDLFELLVQSTGLVDLLLSKPVLLSLPGLVIGLGALAALGPSAPVSMTLTASAVAAGAGFWLTYRWRSGSTAARNALLAGVVLSLVSFIVFFARAAHG